ncbi:unnamed protein product [Peniophora sp. CBMAI 1063]|nr:unnamed protein product [Peniophora sp. CBMAI 1063]
MLSKSFSALCALTLLALSAPADARIRWAERDNRAVLLHPRRFGQEHPAVIEKLSAACDGAVCGNLAGQAITPLLAAQGECTQQDMADSIIDAAQQFDDATKQNMIALAVEYRQAEKNTSPDFTTNPPTNRNSVFCQKAPKNAELNGLVQAQDPANDDTHFFDPATGKTVLKGDQANTFPFGSDGTTASNSTGSASASATTSSSASAATTAVAINAADPCPTAVTVTVTAGAAATNVAATTTAAAAAATTSAAASTASGDIGDFGSCSVPQIEFGAGFDNRKETSFQPVDKTSFNHGSAQGIDIITKFICDTLTNSCKADDTAKATCQTAIAAADGQTAKTGAQADAFNAAFGITTNFASLAVISDQGSTIQAGAAATPAASSATAAAAAATTTAAAAAETSAAATSTAAAAAATSAAASTGSASGANLQQFTGSLGGVTAPAVTDTGSGAQPFAVDGNATFSSLQNALVRSCDVQHNKCANAANSSGNSGDLTVTACGDQQTQCNAQAQTTAASA